MDCGHWAPLASAICVSALCADFGHLQLHFCLCVGSNFDYLGLLFLFYESLNMTNQSENNQQATSSAPAIQESEYKSLTDQATSTAMDLKDKLEKQYLKVKEHAETYPYVWASYIVVYGGFALWTTYRWRKLRKTEDRVRTLQERLRKRYEAEESSSSTKVIEKGSTTSATKVVEKGSTSSDKLCK
ncbi:hypothetical protein VNO78_15927 [Psophocarpus tetragonolobus]|uniref:Transmembrane protein n=1 Tax=Psophocarpus tetragonolobus TaxID=3891 RepID=A0AAN9SFT7_PSOTE